MSINQFFRILIARRLVIAGCVMLALLVGAATALLLPARFEGRTRMILDIIRPDPVTGTIIATQFVRAYTRTQIELMEDPRTVTRVVDQLGWAKDPVRIAAYEKAHPTGDVDIRRYLAGTIIPNIAANTVDASNILEIVYTGRSPQEAKLISGLLRDTFIVESLNLRQEGARRTAAWYNQQASEALTRLTEAENARSRFARENGIVLTTNDTDLETVRLNSLTGQVAAAASAPTIVAAGGAAVNPLQAEMDRLDLQIANAARSLGPNHPQLQALQAQRAALAASMARGGGAAARGGVVVPNLGAIRREFEDAKARVMGQRQAMDRLEQMRGEIEVQRGQYQKTAQRAADLQLESMVADAGIQPMGDPQASDTPSFPKRPMIMGASLAAGLGLGVVLALGLELLRRRVRGGEDLEHASDAPLFAVINERAPEESAAGRLLTMVGGSRRLAGEGRRGSV